MPDLLANGLTCSAGNGPSQANPACVDICSTWLRSVWAKWTTWYAATGDIGGKSNELGGRELGSTRGCSPLPPSSYHPHCMPSPPSPRAVDGGPSSSRAVSVDPPCPAALLAPTAASPAAVAPVLVRSPPLLQICTRLAAMQRRVCRVISVFVIVQLLCTSLALEFCCS